MFDNSLFHAVREGNIEKVKGLIHSNGLPESFKGYSLLCCALEKKHVEITLFLLKEGIDVNSNLNNRYASLYISKYSPRHTPLHIAAKNGDKTIALLLLNNYADIDAKENGGHTPLHYAVEGGNQTLIEFLIRKMLMSILRQRITLHHFTLQHVTEMRK